MVEYEGKSITMSAGASEQKIAIPATYQGQRLDKVLALLLPDYSRSRLQQWLLDGHLTVDGAAPPGKTRVSGGEQVCLRPPSEPASERVEPEAMALDIIHEDESLLVLNKPAGLVMHPGAGNASGTLQNGLLYYAPELAVLPRSGIVHRLDKDTSGILVVAKTFAAHKHLVAALQARTIEREYAALACGVMTAGGRVAAPIGRHPVDRKRMTVRQDGRSAVTHYRVLRRYRAHTHVKCRLETGRTHQIRVHMAHIRYPLLGDPVYGRRLALPKSADEALATVLRGFKRQALHACRLGLQHPETGRHMAWQAPLPADFVALLQALEDDHARVNHD